MAASTNLQDRNITGGNLQPVIVTEILDPVVVAAGGTITVIQPVAGNLNATVVVPGDVEVVQPVHDDLNANANIQVGNADASQTNPVPITDTWTVMHWGNISADDSDKSATVTAGAIWHIFWVWVELTTTATAGDRQIVVELQDDTNDVIGQFRAGAVQAASLTRNYMFAPAMADLVAFRDTDYLMTPMPPTVLLPAGYQIRIYDNNAVDAAADDMVVMTMYGTRTA